jgi:hypothetical protein
MEVRAVMDPEHSRVVETVARKAPGSQTGLTGAVLADGTSLLCWSRFDGSDDDVVCSRRLHEEWGKARRVASNNGVPDIAPKVIAQGPGALLAWSRYDGHEYRLVLARLEGNSWKEMEWKGPGGSLFPAFSVAHDEIFLTFRHAAAEAWGVLAMDGKGRILESTVVSGDLRRRPIPMERVGNELALLWPDGDVTTTIWNAQP